MRRLESQRSIFSRRVPRLAATAVVALSWRSRSPAVSCPTRTSPPRIDIPPAYRAGPRHADAALPSVVWWRGFGSKELTALIEEALTSNFDIAAAVARIVQADANSRDCRLGAVAGRRSQRQRDALSAHRRAAAAALSVPLVRAGGGSGRSERVAYSTSLSASYEIDFWGKNRAVQRAAEELAVASRFDREVVALTTVVSVANAYFLVLESQDRLRIARDNLAAATRVYNLIKQRFDVGTASALDTAQQESLVNTQRASIPPLEQTLRQNMATLAVLIGRTPESVRHSRRQHGAAAHSAGDAGLAFRSDRSAPRHPRGRGAAGIRQRQRLFRARRVLSEHPVDRGGRLPECHAQDAAAAGIGVLQYRGRPDAADASMACACKVSSICRSAGRTNCCSSTARPSSTALPTSSGR